MNNSKITTGTPSNRPWPDKNFHPDFSSQSITKKSVLILFVFAFALRMIYIIQSTANPLFGVSVVDAVVYTQWAQKMVDGVWLWDRVDNYLPIYPAFLAVQQLVFGANPFVNKILQSIVGAFTAVLMAQVAARTWNRQVGLLCGYLLATYWMLVIFGAEKYAETFSIFFQSLTLWLLVSYFPRSWSIFAAGVTFALSAGVRANLFLVLPSGVILNFFRHLAIFAAVALWHFYLWIKARNERAAFAGAGLLAFFCCYAGRTGKI